MSPFCEMGDQGTALGAVNINQSKQALSKISKGGSLHFTSIALQPCLQIARVRRFEPLRRELVQRAVVLRFQHSCIHFLQQARLALVHGDMIG
jgi:hypothetical protein